MHDAGLEPGGLPHRRALYTGASPELSEDEGEHRGHHPAGPGLVPGDPGPLWVFRRSRLERWRRPSFVFFPAFLGTYILGTGFPNLHSRRKEWHQRYWTVYFTLGLTHDDMVPAVQVLLNKY